MSEELIYDENTEPEKSETVVIPEPSYRGIIRGIVRTIYDIQRTRIQLGGRIFALFCNKFDLDFDSDDSKKKADDKIEEIRKSFYRIIDGMNTQIIKDLESKKKLTKRDLKDRSNILKNIKYLTFNKSELIQNVNELVLVSQYEDILENELKHIEMLKFVLETIPFYTDYLHKIRGIGPMMAGVLISEINIYKSKYSSSIHMYAGLDVAPDGKGRTNKECHLVNKKYINKNGEEKEKKSITYNPFLKTKLLGVLAGSFLRTNSPVYRKIYDDYKNRLKNRPDLKEHSDLHINNMAKRYMVKQFLNHLYENWRKYEGLEVHDPYAVAKLGYNPHKSPSC